MSRLIARVAVSAATFHIDKPYDYIVPEKLVNSAVAGMRVTVPFGAGNRKSEGVILSLTTEGARKNLKSVLSFLDESPVLAEENIRLALWMSDRFFCTVFEALRAMLPAGMWFKDGVRRSNDKTVKWVSLCIPGEEAFAFARQKQKSAPKQSAIVKLLAEAGDMTVKEISDIAGAAPSVVKTLENLGIVEINEQIVFRRPDITMPHSAGPIELNAEQQAAYDDLAKLLRRSEPGAALLFGVTGSGKTLVYIKLIEETIDAGKTAIVLVPEIALTPQAVAIFNAYFGDEVAVLHSALGVGERYDEWKRIRSGSVRLVVGTRSAIFAPLSDIGLIVIDEEQEHTYKSENSPRYHARDVAKYRVAHSNALLLLSSATPSVESMFNAKSGKYKLVHIDKRYNDKKLPSVISADMKKELKNNNTSSISSVLRHELEQNIVANEQSILFVNRRGTNSLVACGECGYTYRCERCSVSMTYHASYKRLLCHYCGFSIPVADCCPECSGKLRFVGAGTQKVESELREFLPDSEIIRMDADTVARHNSHDKLLAMFRETRAGILLGTQMVTKGLDFENVTLVGIISADSLLYMGDYRAHERAFSLITQVVGRSGRGEKPGRAVLQTFTPGHDIITLASKQDYYEFYEREIILRGVLGSPPVQDLMALTATGVDEASVLSGCLLLKAALENYLRSDKSIKLLGPAPAPVSKINNRFRYRVLVSCENTKSLRETVAHTLKEFSRDKRSRGVTVYADADTYD